MFSLCVCEYRRVVRCACPTPLGTRRPYRTPSKETERSFYFFPFLSLPFLACRTRALRLIYSWRPPTPSSPHKLSPASRDSLFHSHTWTLPSPRSRFSGTTARRCEFYGPAGLFIFRVRGPGKAPRVGPERQLLFHPLRLFLVFNKRGKVKLNHFYLFIV